MGMEDIRAKITALATECDTIAAKAELGEADLTRLEAIAAERQGLERQMKAMSGAAEFKAWAGQSAGMLPLASANGGTRVEGLAPAGAAQLTIERDGKGRKSVLVDDDGAPVIDAKLYETLTGQAYAKAFRTYLKGGIHAVKGDALKVLQEGLDTSGGYLVPEDIQNRLIAKEPAPTTLASRVTRLNTSRDSMTIPKVTWTTDNIYTTGMRVTWTGEIPAAATTHRVTEPVFGQERIAIFTAMMSLPLTNDMVEDSATDIVGWSTGKFQETYQLLMDNMIVNGSGATQPDGILINANFVTNDVHTGAAAALTWDGIKNIAYDLPEQYDRNAAFYMNKTNCAKALAGLVDGDGRPYWATGSQDYGFAGQRINRDLFGYPVVFSAFMPNVSAGLYPIIFGDLSGYYLVQRVGFTVQVLRELYAETNQILLLGRCRFGGKLVEDERVRGQVVSA